MKNVIVILLLVATISVSAQEKSRRNSAKDTITAQVAKEKIIIENGFWGDNYYISGQEYSRKQINNILETDKFLVTELKSARRIQSFGNLTMTIGIVLTGATIYQVFESSWAGTSLLTPETNSFGIQEDSNPFLLTALLALGFDITGIVLISTANSSFEKVIQKYNHNLLTNSSGFDFRFNITSVSLTFNF